MRYLLDTNIMSDLMRHRAGSVARHIQRVGEAQVCTSIIVAAEMRYGAAKKNSSRLAAEVEALLSRMQVFSWQEPADRTYGQMRTQLERAGRLLSTNDVLIAAHALTLGCVMVTANEREFRMVKNLQVENWLR
jgi:tRNA(fMet)-specific endonuclease VapC